MYSLTRDQKLIKKEILAKLKLHHTILLGAVTGFGKTVVAWDLIKTFKRNKKRILVLTHGQREIRTNFTNSFAANKHFEITSFKDAKDLDRHQVVVSLPQTLVSNLKKIKAFDYLIVDEAHQFYHASTVQKIIKHLLKSNSKLKKILLTATHYNFQDIPKILFSREKALKADLICNASISLDELPHKITAADFSSTKELKKTTYIKKEPIKRYFKKIIKIVNFTQLKSIFIVHNCQTADYIYQLLKDHKIPCILSHGKNDIYSKNIDAFKKNSSIKSLVVVNRANLGFDCKEVKYLIDLTMSKNISRIEQMFGRVLRKYKDEKKYLFKAYPQDFKEEYQLIMSGVMALSVDEIYKSWSGSYQDLKILPLDVINSDSDHLNIEDQKNPTIKKELKSFQEYIDVFKNTSKHVSLSEAIFQIRAIRSDKFYVKYTTYDQLKKLASFYNSLREWEIKSKSSYATACKLKVQREIAKELNWNCRSPLSHEEIKLEAAKYNSLSEWKKNSRSSYNAASNKKIQRQIAKELNWDIRETAKYTPEILEQEASKYKSLHEWFKKDRGSYEAAKYRKLQKKIASKLNWESNIYTFDKYVFFAKKFKSMQDWRKGHPNSYSSAAKKKLHWKVGEMLGWKKQRKSLNTIPKPHS